MKQKAPIYTLPHGIEVIGEYPARGKNPYARLRIRPHPFFPNVRVISNGISVHKSRAMLASQLGRQLTPTDHAHHGDRDRSNDTVDNLELLSAAEHNRLHKTGSKHRADSKAKTSAALKLAYAEGRHKPTDPVMAARNLSEFNAAVRAGKIPLPRLGVRKKICKHGHERTPESVSPNGSCRICEKERALLPSFRELYEHKCVLIMKDGRLTHDPCI